MTLTQNKGNKQVAIWLLIGVGMTVVQIALGGITRLTGSGLSITQWDVITGALPPLNEQQWLLEFEKYKLTPQFRLLNFDFTVHDFKYIFFWEWFHRLWARSIGLVFAIGFIWFLVKGYFKKQMIQPLIYLFLLGALQGAIGWIMVASGLVGDAVYVKPTRLALHFIFALGLLSYTFWFALQLLVPKQQISYNAAIAKWSKILLLLVGVQLVYGALMAGHKAATAAATWPTINGQWIPTGLWKYDPVMVNFVENTLLIHFIHRGLAYVLLVIIVLLTLKLYKQASFGLLQKLWWLPALIVIIQVILGIAAVINSLHIIPGKWGVFEWLAQLHQLVGMLLLLSVVGLLYLVRKPKQ